MDCFYEAVSLYRRRKYDLCIEICNSLLQKNPHLQGPWELKMRSMTQRVYVDDIEADDGVAGERRNSVVVSGGAARRPSFASVASVKDEKEKKSKRELKKKKKILFLFYLVLFFFE